MRAEALSRKPNHISGLALSRSGDPAIGDFGDLKVIRKYCELTPNLIARGDRILLASPREAQIRPDQEVAYIGAV
ncbi:MULTISPECIES: hypothetical protein [unclassified Bradyrhizobium]